jgi:DNA-binding transcriptional regulator YiaG
MSRRYLKPPQPQDWKRAREARGLSAKQAAEVIRVDASTWRGWESGKHTGPWHALSCFNHECDALEERHCA